MTVNMLKKKEDKKNILAFRSRTERPLMNSTKIRNIFTSAYNHIRKSMFIYVRLALQGEAARGSLHQEKVDKPSMVV